MIAALAFALLAVPVRAQTAPRFFAADFFDAVVPGRVRGQGWPRRATLLPVKATPAQVSATLQGVFKEMIACSGRPISDEKVLSTHYIPDGYHRSAYWLSFDPGEMQRIEVAPGNDQPLVQRNATWLAKCESHPSGSVVPRLAFECSGWKPAYYRLAMVAETGEVVIVDDASLVESEYRSACETGEQPQVILARVPGA